MIQLKNITKKYGAHLAVDQISFVVPQGAVAGLLGPNGAGKTTTMRILTGFFPPTDGSAEVGGYDVLTQSHEVRRVIGYMPENPPVYPEMIVSRFLRFVAEIKGVPTEKINSSVELAMEKVQLSHYRGRIIGHLSRGYRQRVGLAQALVHDPKVLILDEPTLGLDPSQIIEIRQLIRSLAHAHTLLLSSHILSEVQASCDQVIIINRGKIVTKDTLKNLTEGQRLRVRLKQSTGTIPTFENFLSKIPGVESIQNVSRDLPTFEMNFSGSADELSERIYQTCVERQWPLLELSRLKTSLEEIFLRLTH